MTETQSWQGVRVRAAGFRATGRRAGGGPPGGLWAWLHAQALLDGPADPAELAEDDSRRLGAWRAAGRRDGCGL
jgi:hypothetical protein